MSSNFVNGLESTIMVHVLPLAAFTDSRFAKSHPCGFEDVGLDLSERDL